ncbi:MAG: hypothetical protein H6722_05075 [Sandaracinus sp.]|nr:hypothetical protein [Sandaracinus sp.]
MSLALRLAVVLLVACEPNAIGPMRMPDGGRVNPYADGSVAPPLDAIEGAPEGFGVAAGAALVGIEVYQTIRIPLVTSGRAVTPGAPLFAGKDMLVRVYATPAERPGRPMVAVVRVDGPGGSFVAASAERPLDGPSTIADPRSTYDVEIPGDFVVPGVQLSAALVEYGGPGSLDARFPRLGGEPLVLPLLEGVIDVVLVPIEHVDAGVTNVPIVDEATVAVLEDELRALWPLTRVNARVRAPMSWTEPLPPTSPTSWDGLLEAVTALREAEAEADEYFVALVNPGVTREAYCGLACIAGIAHVNVDDLASMRVAIGLGFDDPTSRASVVHELGHAHGRGHAPCGVAAAIDEAFPREDGLVGDWGWDSRTHALVEPTAGDFMGYCEPHWIAPFNYLRLHARIGSGARGLRVLDEVPHHVFSRAPFRAPRWVRQTSERMGGDELALALDGEGHPLASVAMRRVPASIPGFERLVVPVVPGAARYRLGDGTELRPL